MRSLKRLALPRAVPEEAVQALRMELPNCAIVAN